MAHLAQCLKPFIHRVNDFKPGRTPTSYERCSRRQLEVSILSEKIYINESNVRLSVPTELDFAENFTVCCY